MATQIKILAYSPSGPLAYKTATKALVYKTLENPEDDNVTPPQYTTYGYWHFNIMYFGYNNYVMYGDGIHRSGHHYNLGGDYGSVRNDENFADGQIGGGTRWANLRIYWDSPANLIDPDTPPVFHVNDNLPGYDPGTIDYEVSPLGGSATVMNGTIRMSLFWVGTLQWIPPL